MEIQKSLANSIHKDPQGECLKLKFECSLLCGKHKFSFECLNIHNVSFIFSYILENMIIEMSVRFLFVTGFTTYKSIIMLFVL